ncbi:MAG: helix-turn-helix transcriptional regulator [Acidimicrobiia bacterium]
MGSSGKLERLLNLTAALLETSRALSAAEIKRKMAGYPENKIAFRRAFERDKDDLREMGIPIDVIEITESGQPEAAYRIPKDQYYLRDPGLSADEVAALHLAASAVHLDGITGTGALWKLGGVPTPVPEGDQLAAIPADANLVALFQAVGERRPVTFGYRGTERALDPYRLDFQKGRWYVTGFDHGRQDERVFRLDRLTAAVTAGRARSFERPVTAIPGTRLEPWQLGEGRPVHGRVLVDADQAPIAVAQVGAAAVVEQRGDGSVVLELEVTNPVGFRSFVLGFLDHAEVLGPAELRADMVAWLEATLAASNP